MNAIGRQIADAELAQLERTLKVRSPIVAQALNWATGKKFFITRDEIGVLKDNEGNPRYSGQTLVSGVKTMLESKQMQKRGREFKVQAGRLNGVQGWVVDVIKGNDHAE